MGWVGGWVGATLRKFDKGEIELDPRNSNPHSDNRQRNQQNQQHRPQKGDASIQGGRSFDGVKIDVCHHTSRKWVELNETDVTLDTIENNSSLQKFSVIFLEFEFTHLKLKYSHFLYFFINVFILWLQLSYHLRQMPKFIFSGQFLYKNLTNYDCLNTANEIGKMMSDGSLLHYNCVEWCNYFGNCRAFTVSKNVCYFKSQNCRRGKAHVFNYVAGTDIFYKMDLNWVFDDKQIWQIWQK